jgi:hypothetical protein
MQAFLLWNKNEGNREIDKNDTIYHFMLISVIFIIKMDS